MTVAHALSFDVENWYDGSLHRQWTHGTGQVDGRLPRDVDDLLNLLDQFGTKATFFILGRVAENHPDTVRRIAARGHELACHALDHVRLCDTTPQAYRDGLKRCRSLLQDLSGQAVKGHRAPSWSISRGTPWAVDALLEAGFAYDSSVFPMYTGLYGEPTAPAEPYRLTAGGASILELPPAVRRIGPLPVPYGGGTYWRLLPLWLIRRLLQGARTPQVAYLHPWELNPEPVPLPKELPLLPRIVLRIGVRGARAKLAHLLGALPFHPLAVTAERLQSDPTLPTFSLEGGLT